MFYHFYYWDVYFIVFLLPSACAPSVHPLASPLAVSSIVVTDRDDDDDD